MEDGSSGQGFSVRGDFLLVKRVESTRVFFDETVVPKHFHRSSFQMLDQNGGFQAREPSVCSNRIDIVYCFFSSNSLYFVCRLLSSFTSLFLNNFGKAGEMLIGNCLT